MLVNKLPAYVGAWSMQSPILPKLLHRAFPWCQYFKHVGGINHCSSLTTQAQCHPIKGHNFLTTFIHASPHARCKGSRSLQYPQSYCRMKADNTWCMFVIASLTARQRRFRTAALAEAPETVVVVESPAKAPQNSKVPGRQLPGQPSHALLSLLSVFAHHRYLLTVVLVTGKFKPVQIRACNDSLSRPTGYCLGRYTDSLTLQPCSLSKLLVSIQVYSVYVLPTTKLCKDYWWSCWDWNDGTVHTM